MKWYSSFARISIFYSRMRQIEPKKEVLDQDKRRMNEGLGICPREDEMWTVAIVHGLIL